VVRRNLEGKQPKAPEAEQEKYVGALGQFLMHQAYFTMRLGKISEANSLCQDSISSLRSVQKPEALAHALSYYAVLNWTIGKLDLALKLLLESLPLSKEHGSPWQITLFTGILGNVAYERGEYEYSYRLLREALERSQAIGDPRLIGFISAYLGRSALKLERTMDVEGILWEAAQITQESGDRFGNGLILEQLALVEQANRNFTSSEKLFEASVNLFQEIGDTWYLSRALTSWGDFRQSLGDVINASEHYKQAIRLSLDAQAFLIAMNAFVGLAEVYAQENKVELALEIALGVMHHPASPQDAKADANNIVHNMKSRLCSDEVEAIYHRVEIQTLEEFANTLQ
jgi:tetratricopeptide (TPR) repeat protein